MAARGRSKAQTRSRRGRRRRGKTGLVRPLIAFAAVGLAMALGGFTYFGYFQPRHPPKLEANGPSAPIPPAPPTPSETHREAPAAVRAPGAGDDSEAVKASRNKSAVAPRDPALDRWFVDAYLRCWTPPATLPAGEKYAAQIRVTHKSDGSLASAPLLVNPPSDPAWRAFADSALRAVTKCNPLQAPQQYLAHFEQWRKMTLHFAPDAPL